MEYWQWRPFGQRAELPGTNSITVGPNGRLETTYNLVTTNGSLTLNGLMYLYTADTFNTVTINGTELSPGTYSFASLNSAYPTNFPTTWPVQLGSSTGTNTGVGSITVLSGPPPSQPARIGSATFAGGNLTHRGKQRNAQCLVPCAHRNRSVTASGWLDGANKWVLRWQRKLHRNHSTHGQRAGTVFHAPIALSREPNPTRLGLRPSSVALLRRVDRQSAGGDGAFCAGDALDPLQALRAREGGVALRFPPQSKTLARSSTAAASQRVLDCA